MNLWTFIVIIAVLGVVLFWRRQTRDKLAGICAMAIGRNTKKNERKEKIMALLAEPFGAAQDKRKKISNSDIRKALGVSAATATRYMNELEKEGKVKQVGKVGHAVTYRLK